jgi:hypothetical protein
VTIISWHTNNILRRTVNTHPLKNTIILIASFLTELAFTFSWMLIQKTHFHQHMRHLMIVYYKFLSSNVCFELVFGKNICSLKKVLHQVLIGSSIFVDTFLLADEGGGVAEIPPHPSWLPETLMGWMVTPRFWVNEPDASLDEESLLRQLWSIRAIPVSYNFVKTK